MGQSIGVYAADFTERQNYIAADGVRGRDYLKDELYLPHIVPNVSDIKSELTAGELNLTSAGNNAVTVCNVFVVGDRVKNFLFCANSRFAISNFSI